MKLVIDDANFAAIKKLYEYYPIDGVTTNPSILAKTGQKPYELLSDIRAFLGEDAELHVQAVSRKAEDMVREGIEICDRLGKSTYIKIPAIPEGIKAIKALSALGYRTTGTCVYTPMQAFMAAKAGACYVAPYVNRIDNLGGDGVGTVKKIQDILRSNGLETKVLAASFKNTQQIQELCAYGVDAVTAAPDLIEGFLSNACVDAAVDKFIADFEGLCGEGRTMLDA